MYLTNTGLGERQSNRLNRTAPTRTILASEAGGEGQTIPWGFSARSRGKNGNQMTGGI